MSERPPGQEPENIELQKQITQLTTFLWALEERKEGSGQKPRWATDISRYNEKTGESLPVEETDPVRRCRILSDRRQEIENSDEQPRIKELKMAILRRLSITYTSQMESSLHDETE
jgi:hypothetical protein